MHLNRANRRHLNLLANAIEGAAGRLVTWLRAKAERKGRPKPFAFPTPMEEMMDRIYAPMIQRMSEQVVADLLRRPMSTVKIRADDAEGIVFTRLLPSDIYVPPSQRGPVDNRVFGRFNWLEYPDG